MNDYEQLKSLIDNLKENYHCVLFHPEKKSVLSSQSIKKKGNSIVLENLLKDITEFYYELNDLFLYTESDVLMDNYGKKVLNLLNNVYQVISKKLGNPPVPSLEELIEDLSKIMLDDKMNIIRTLSFPKLKERSWKKFIINL